MEHTASRWIAWSTWMRGSGWNVGKKYYVRSFLLYAYIYYWNSFKKSCFADASVKWLEERAPPLRVRIPVPPVFLMGKEALGAVDLDKVPLPSLLSFPFLLPPTTLSRAPLWWVAEIRLSITKALLLLLKKWANNAQLHHCILTRTLLCTRLLSLFCSPQTSGCITASTSGSTRSHELLLEFLYI